jgi:hypothetical protein
VLSLFLGGGELVRFGRMRGRGRVALAAAAVVVVAIVVAGMIRRPSPPTWKGKTAEEWFKEFRRAGGGPQTTPPGAIFSVMPGPNNPWALTGPFPPGTVRWVRTVNGRQVITFSVPPGTLRPGFYYSPEEMLRDPSADGLRGLGTNASIFLEGELKRKDLPLAGTYARLYPKAPAVLRKVLPAPSEPSSRVRRDAAIALAVLGTNAWPAAPSFIRAVKMATVPDWNHFRVALSRISFPAETWDPVLEYFSKEGNDYSAMELVQSTQSRTWTAFKVVTNAFFSTNISAAGAAFYQAGDFKGMAEPVVRALVRAFKSGDSARRELSAMALKRLEEQAVSAIPEMIEALKNRNDDVRYEAARVLEVMGTNALPAAEALRRATNDSSVMVQRASRRALEKVIGDR